MRWRIGRGQGFGWDQKLRNWVPEGHSGGRRDGPPCGVEIQRTREVTARPGEGAMELVDQVERCGDVLTTQNVSTERTASGLSLEENGEAAQMLAGCSFN